jgi:hypothetical protein
VDTGVRCGDTVSMFYDPMISKLIAWGEDRPSALRALLRGLAQYQIVGVANNLAFLQRCISHELFVAGAVNTSFLGAHLQQCLPPSPAPPLPMPVLATAALAQALLQLRQAQQQPAASSSSPWAAGSSCRLLQPAQPGASAETQAFVEPEADGQGSSRLHSASVQRSSEGSASAPASFLLQLRLGSAAAPALQPASDAPAASAAPAAPAAPAVHVAAAGSLQRLSSASSSVLRGFEAATIGRDVAGTQAFLLSASFAAVQPGSSSSSSSAASALSSSPSTQLRATVVFSAMSSAGQATGGMELHIFPEDPAAMLLPGMLGSSSAQLFAPLSLGQPLPMPPPSAYKLLLPAAPFGSARKGAGASSSGGTVKTPMPGKVVKVLVQPGEEKGGRERGGGGGAA